MTIPPNSSGTVTQEMKITNTQQGEKNIMLKLKLTYKAGGNSVGFSYFIYFSLLQTFN